MTIILTTGLVCPEADCRLAFRTVDAWAAHLRAAHASVRSIYGCPRCGTYYADDDDAGMCCEEDGC